MDCSTPGFPVLHCLPELAQTHVHWIGDAIQPSHLLLPPSPLVLNLSQHQGVFQWVSSLHRWPKYWSFSLNISPSNGYSGLISFRIDYFDFLAVQVTPKSCLQRHNSKASILQCFMVQLSHPFMTTGKNVALTVQNLVSKVMSLLFNMLSMFVIAFLPVSQFKSINSSALSHFYGPTLTSIHDYLEKQLWLYGPLLANLGLCFLICCQACHSFSSKE